MYEQEIPKMNPDLMLKRQAAMGEQIRGHVIAGGLTASTREVPMAETMNRLLNVISAIDDAVGELDQRTHVLRQPSPANMAKEPRPERVYSPLVASLNEQINRLERLHVNIRQITSELEL